MRWKKKILFRIIGTGITEKKVKKIQLYNKVAFHSYIWMGLNFQSFSCHVMYIIQAIRGYCLTLMLYSIHVLLFFVHYPHNSDRSFDRYYTMVLTHQYTDKSFRITHW